MRKTIFPCMATIREIPGPVLAIAAALLLALAGLFAAMGYVSSTPPDTITLISGPDDSSFRRHAEAYRAILARNGVKLEIVPSQGSMENLVHLSDPSFHIDAGFVQGGLVQGGLLQGLDISRLASLGSIAYEPLLVFYRGMPEMDKLSDFRGKRLAIGKPSSGTHALALALLKANDMAGDEATELLDLDADDAATELLAGRLDALFVMGDSASQQLISGLLHAPGLRLMSFVQAEAYTRNIGYLNKLELARGAIDLGRDIPAHDVLLVAPTVELVVRDGLHPALSDLLLETAQEVHGGIGLMQRSGEFPAPLEHEFRISDEARRYYTSGKSFLYRHLPFWLATLASRLLALLLPLMVVLIPGLRLLPPLYRWRIRSRFTKWYGALLEVEHGMVAGPTPEERQALLQRLDEIERAVNRLRVPKSFGDQFYGLLLHIDYVRRRLRNDTVQ